MNHLKQYIGVYILAIVVALIYWHEPTDEYPVWVMWLMIPVILWKVPPFSVEDWLSNKVGRFILWISTPFRNWQGTWPKWFRVVFAMIILILIEEILLKPMGQTMYPWRMDFS